MKTTKIALGLATASLTLAGAMLSPQAAAQTQAERIAEANAKRTAVLEAQVNDMSTMMQAMQAELSRVKTIATSSADSAKVQELDQWMASMKHAPMQVTSKDSVFIVRGGWMHMNDNRGSTGILAGTGITEDLLTSEADQDAFYYGGAIDFSMNNDLFGLVDGVSFGIELGIEYSELADDEVNGLGTALTAFHGTPALSSVTVNMLRVSAAPKIKFMHGSKLRPWIIPVGLDFNIISPPSDAVTVLNTGMQFGAGVDFQVFDGIIVGLDGRYHWTPDDVDGVDTDGFTLGGIVGFNF